MTEDYYNPQNLLKTIDNSNYIFPEKKSPRKSNQITNSSSNEGNKTLENTDESYGIEEFPQKEEDIDHLLNFQLENENNPFQINNNRINSVNNINKIPHFSFLNHNPNENVLNKPISGRIPHPRKTHGYIPVNRNRFKIGSHKRNSSGEKKVEKKIQSRYSSASENKYHFMKRFAGNQNFTMNSLNENNIAKVNYGPMDSIRGAKNHSIGRPINNINNIMNDSRQKIYTYRNPNSNNYNTINGLYLNSNSNQNYNPFDNSRKNKTTSNYSFNTINTTRLQDNIQLVRIEKQKNNEVNDLTNQNNLMEYFTKNPQSINNININTNNYNLNNNYSTMNNPTINLESQRLTNVGYNNMASPYYGNFTEPQDKKNNLIINFNENIENNKKEEPEIAIVTKISSSDENDDKIKNNTNVTRNNVNVENNENYYINQDLDKIINQINDHTFKVLTQQDDNDKYINNMQIYNNQIPNSNHNKIVNKKANSNTNKYISEQELNQIFGQASNSYLPQKQNTYIPTTSTIPNNNYNTENINLKNIYIQPQNPQNKFIEYNQPQSTRATITNDKVNNNNGLEIEEIEEQPGLNNNVDLIYNDFDGSGLMKNYNGMSLPGKNIAGETKTNQDAFVCKTNIHNIKDFNILGVLDGHGPDGHFVSEFVSEFIPSQIINNPEIKKLSNPESIYKKLKENNCKIISQAFIITDNQLRSMEFDISESGCTCCLIIHIGTHLICANTGDSRALVVYDQANDPNSKSLNFLDTVPLSIDYKPELPEEISRIILAGGVVEQMKDEFGMGVGPYRVWVKGKDYPGLAMSRSIGDLHGKSIGVIPDPGILEYDLNKSTKYVIACSDGVWEFLNNEAVMNIGKRFYLQNNAVDFCHELVSRALKEWQKNDKIVDDITAVVAFF